MNTVTFVLGFVLGALWSAAAGIVLVGYLAMKYAGKDVETPRATHAHYFIASTIIGMLMVYSFAKNRSFEDA